MCVLHHLGEGVTLLGGALGLAGWVAEGENNGALVECGHVSDDLLGKGSSHSSHSYDAKQRKTTRGFRDDNGQTSVATCSPKKSKRSKDDGYRKKKKI